ncbi:MAG: hypothetical protein NT007_18025 [Candidatus Kapabacteria bacterium]|nr:hypothetical protein [Candidatus Kapabacteria bacterium]
MFKISSAAATRGGEFYNGITGMNNFSEDKLLVTARSVHTIMISFLSDLASTGLTTGMLTAFATANDDYEAARNAQNTAINERDNKTEERIAAGNALYAKVSNYCDVGKRVFASTNQAKYNDYVIYGAGGTGGALTSPANFAYNFSTNTFSWDAITNATSYQIEASDNGTDWSEIYADVSLTFIYTPSSGVSKHYRVRARNAGGFGDFAAELLFTYYASLAAPPDMAISLTGPGLPLTINVNWGAVAGATSYRVYESIVAVGAAAGIYNQIAEPATNSYSEASVENKRYYFYVVAKNSYRESASSAVVMVDVPVNPT